MKRGCQSSCQTDSRTSLLCNSLISPAVMRETHTHAHTHACVQMHSTCKFYTWLHLFCRRKEGKKDIFNLQKSARWLQTRRSGRRLVIVADGGDASKFHLLQISSSKGSTLIRGVWDPRAPAAALRDKIRNSEEVLFNANNPLGFPTAVQQKTWCLCAVCHGKQALPTNALLD